MWILRRGISGSTFGGGEADQLPARGALGLAAKAAVDDGHADAVTGFRTDAVERDADGRLVLVGEDGRRLDPVDEVIVLTGFRPDLTFLDELRLGLDERLQAPVELAPLIDPNQHSCGTVYPHGHRELSHPEQGIYLVGMKSYGRAPTFLAMTGYEQVRSVAAAIAGDIEAADRVELTLPETGVCGGAGLFDEPDASTNEQRWRRLLRDPHHPPDRHRRTCPHPAAADGRSTQLGRRHDMSRVQLALRVPDLEASIAFYTKLFGTEPAKRRDGYANFAIAEPPLKLVLIEGTAGEDTRMDHLGVEVDSTEAVNAATARLSASGLETDVEKTPPAATPSRTRSGSTAPAKNPGRYTSSKPTPTAWPSSRAAPAAPTTQPIAT